MASPAGIAGQLGIAAEVTYGTYVAPARFLEVVSENLQLDVQRIESRGIRAGRRVLLSSQWAPGRRGAGGPVALELANVGQGLLWKHALGGVATAGPTDSAYTHTYTPGDLSALSLTVQVGKPRQDGTVSPHSYLGCVIAGWELSCAAGEIPLWTLNMLAQDETTAQSLGAASYPAAHRPFTFVQGTLSIGGSAVDVASVTVRGENTLADDRYFIRGSGLRRIPLENGWRRYTASIVANFDNLTQYDRYRNATEAALSLAFVGGLVGSSATYDLTVSGNVRFDGTTPNLDGPELLDLPLEAVFIASGAADGSAITVTQRTSEATP